MKDILVHKETLSKKGFVILDNVFSTEEIDHLLLAIKQVDVPKETFRKSTDLFAIRQFLKEVPATIDFIFNKNSKPLSETFSAKIFLL